MSVESETNKRSRLRNLGRAWDEHIYERELATNSVNRTAAIFGLDVRTVRAVVADCRARRQRQKQKEFA